MASVYPNPQLGPAWQNVVSPSQSFLLAIGTSLDSFIEVATTDDATAPADDLKGVVILSGPNSYANRDKTGPGYVWARCLDGVTPARLILWGG
jgi:hypothetical protein